MKEELAVKNLREVKEVFDKFGIKYWLDWGTLLGAVRDGKIIEWDHDIDLGTMDGHWEKIVSAVPELKGRGFDVHLKKSKIYKDIFQISVALNRFGCPMCVSPYHVKGENAFIMSLAETNLISRGLGALHRLLLFPKPIVKSKWKFAVKVLGRCLSLLPPKSKKTLSDVVWLVRRRCSNKFTLIVVPKHHFEKLGIIEFYGMTFNVPSDVEDYLRYKYGEDWKTPKKEWETCMCGGFRTI